jgi:hypothetical protein
MHSLFGITPWVFGQTLFEFRNSFFFNINKGLTDFPLFGGTIQSKEFAAFWFVYFGLALIPLGLLLKHFTKFTGYIPQEFAIAYLAVVLIGVYMIPFSGMTIIMLPHTLWMLKDSRSTSKNKIEKENTTL